MQLQRALLWAGLIVLACDAGLIALGAVMNARVPMPFEVIEAQLDLKDEGNLAVWYSSAQLLLVGLSAAAIALLTQPKSGSRALHRLIWLAVAATAVFVSADETAQLHEWLGQRYAQRVGEHDAIATRFHISEIYKWMIVYAIPVALGALLLIWLAIRLRQTSTLAALLAAMGVACWITAFASEYVESQIFEATQHHRERGWRGQQPTVEEGSELLGAGLLLASFLTYLRAALPTPGAPRARSISATSSSD
jgi:hypothetical protein